MLSIPVYTNLAPSLAELFLHDYKSSAVLKINFLAGELEGLNLQGTIRNHMFYEAIKKIYPHLCIWPHDMGQALCHKETTFRDWRATHLGRMFEIR